MADVSVHVELKTNWRSILSELDRLERAPKKAAMYLDGVLHSGFAATQASVHVITGSLKSSGKASTTFDGNDWEGEISYGGASLGVNNPVTYAIYEKARGAHWAGPSSAKGSHDFMAPLSQLDSLYIKAILRALS